MHQVNRLHIHELAALGHWRLMLLERVVGEKGFVISVDARITGGCYLLLVGGFALFIH